MKILHSKIIGSGNNHIIILHGLLGMGDNWKSVANILSNDKNDEIGNNITTNRLIIGVSRGTRSHERGIFEAQQHAKRRHGGG